jgi:NAD(P)-dependent dehydrogenase (short-subunit alcohol dehydrogenase family)
MATTERLLGVEALSLAGRKALITGAARGMGRAHALTLASRGASVALVDLDRDELLATAAEVRGGSSAGAAATAPRVDTIVADITTRVSAEAIVAEAVERLGGLDVLVHNAGRMYSLTGLEDTDDDDFHALLAINVDAPLYLTRAALPHLRVSTHARVIFISSQWGQVPDGHSYGYMTSKAAQLGLMKTMACEFAGEGILVNAVTPGAIDTRMVPEEFHEAERAAIPLGRLGAPEEIAAAVAFLASDAASFITGQVIPVNGGACIVGI